MFLTADELRALTGYQKPVLQRRWLAETGYSFEVRCDGRPVVSRAHYESRQHGPQQQRTVGPNLGALD